MPTLFDALALGTILLFAAVSMFRGVIHELVELCSWLAAFMGARLFAQPLSEYLAAAQIRPPALAAVLAFVILFVGIHAGMQLVQVLLERILAKLGLGGLNRSFGALFGAAKGVLAVSLAVLICGFTELPKTDGWRHAKTAFVFEQLAMTALPYLPPFMAEKMNHKSLSTE